MDHVSVVGQGLDDEISGDGEVGPALPVGEQVDVTARSITHAVLPNGIATSERKSVITSGRAKGDLGQLAVAGVHAGDLTRRRPPTRPAEAPGSAVPTHGVIPVGARSMSTASSGPSDQGRRAGRQHKVNRRTAQRLGWEVVAELTDNDRSASKAGVIREAFEAMLKAITVGRLADGTKVRGVAVLNEDRLARRAGDYERFVEALTADDGRVFADERGPKDLYAEDVEGLGLVGVAFSKIESRKARRRLRRFHRDRAENGQPAGGTRAFGWAADRRSLDPDEAPLVAKAAKEFAAGRSLNSIAREWIAAGVRTSVGNQWSVRSLRLTLANPRLCGWRMLHGEIVTDDSGDPKPSTLVHESRADRRVTQAQLLPRPSRPACRTMWVRKRMGRTLSVSLRDVMNLGPDAFTMLSPVEGWAF